MSKGSKGEEANIFYKALAQSYAQNTMREKRFIHSVNVAEMAKMLAVAQKLPPLQVQKAENAGFVHDIAKDWSREKLLQTARDYAMIMDNDQLESPALYHSIVGAEYVKRTLCSDAEIVAAVRYHTTARPDMAILEQILFVADCISKERCYCGVEEVRSLAMRDLDAATLQILKHTLCDVIGKEAILCSDTIAAYHAYIRKAGCGQAVD